MAEIGGAAAEEVLPWAREKGERNRRETVTRNTW